MKNVQEWLSAAAAWQWAALVFQSPTAEAQADINLLAAELPEGFRSAAEEMSLIPLEEWETEFHRVIGPGGCPAIESSYDENALAGRGPLLAEIAGFYEAFAYRPDPRVRETPDHVSIELGFLSYLALKVAYALYEERPEQREIAEQAYWRFMETHPLYWLGAFSERIHQTESWFYESAANWLARWIETQARGAPSSAETSFAV